MESAHTLGMTRNHKTRFGALALCLSALALAPAADAKAESSSLPCPSLLTSAAQAPDGSPHLAVVRTKELDRWQARPWARLPLGVALWVRPPRGMTMADLYNLAANCKQESDERSPLCVQGASIRVDRQGGLYVLRITSESRATALEIQRRSRQD